MGLAERREMQKIKEGRFEAFKTKVQEIMGRDVTWSVDWDSLAIEGMSSLYEQGMTEVFFQPTEAALQSICADEMGKSALAEKLTEIIIKNTDGIFSSRQWASFEDGVLTLNHKTDTNLGDGKDREKSLVTLLENAL